MLHLHYIICMCVIKQSQLIQRLLVPDEELSLASCCNVFVADCKAEDLLLICSGPASKIRTSANCACNIYEAQFISTNFSPKHALANAEKQISTCRVLAYPSTCCPDTMSMIFSSPWLVLTNSCWGCDVDGKPSCVTNSCGWGKEVAALSVPCPSTVKSRTASFETAAARCNPGAERARSNT